MLKLAYRIGVELALMKLAQPTLAAGVVRGGSRARFLQNLRKVLVSQGGEVPRQVQQDIARELSLYDRVPEVAKVLREAYGLGETTAKVSPAAAGMSPLSKILGGASLAGVGAGSVGLGAALGG